MQFAKCQINGYQPDKKIEVVESLLLYDYKREANDSYNKQVKNTLKKKKNQTKPLKHL